MSDSIDFKISKRLSLFSGTGVPYPENFDKWNIFQQCGYRFYCRMINVFIIVEISFLMVRVAHSTDDLGVICACLVGTMYALHILTKIFIFNVYRKLFKRLFDEVRDISRMFLTNPFHDGFLEFYNENYYKIVRMSLTKGLMESIGNIALIFIFILRSIIVGVPEDAITPALTWTPYDGTENPNYSLTCLMELVAFESATFRNVVMDLLVWLILVVPTIHLRYLNHILKIIINDESTKTSEYDSSVTEQEIKFKKRSANFIIWLKYHQRVLKFIQDFRTISSPYLAASYLCTLVNLSLAGLVAVSTSSWDIYQQIIINAIIISNTVQLYLLSIAGDWISEASESAVNGGYSDLLFLGDKELRYNYLFASARTKHSLNIRFGGINALNSNHFGQLIRLTLTYFTTVVQLKKDADEELESQQISHT